MTSIPLSYWEPGSEERQLRVFISHRYGNDQSLYDEVIRALNRAGFSVQDISLSAKKILEGPRGGKLPTLEVQSEIAARIYTSDIVIAPSRVGVGRSEWVTWEVQLAAIGYGIPILFVNQRGQKYKAKLVSEIEKLSLPHAACEPTPSEIVRSVAELVKNTRPTWGMRRDEPDASILFRGPSNAALNKVLTTFPFNPRLTDPEMPPPPTKRGWWPPFGHRDH